MLFLFFWKHVNDGCLLIGCLKVQIASHEVVFHHQDGVDHLTGTRHPHLMTRETLGGTHRYLIVAEDTGYHLRLTLIADQ